MAARSPLRQTNAEALASSQQAIRYRQENASTNALPLLPFLSRNESPEQWTSHENLLYSCLRTGDDKTAHSFLEKLASRFGKDDERVMGLRGLYQEAMADDDRALLQILQGYDDILAEDPTNTPIRKRRIALLRGLSREADAINAVADLLAVSPTDTEAWAELADLYIAQGLYQQAEFCLEEILLSAPNAWNVHARLGEILYVSAAASQDQIAALADSVRRFCRSIELCDGYIRGCYGLKTASEDLISVIKSASHGAAQNPSGERNYEIPVPSIKVLQRLNEKATSVLAAAARDSSGNNNPQLPDLTFVSDMLKSSTMPRKR
ncbi:MAG: hypothetical protein L6R39_002769 [Caloplaca ligustica]|nr:MAG: hypothetical protein L6R39_002769 [Caloplaca ligustica]